MARIDLARRAQIGRDRSARTRAELLRAARELYAARPFDQVTVDDLVSAAGVAKGTFYVHFDSLAELQSIVADELAREFDELLQPRRLALDDPVERIAAGCGAFIAQTLRNPAWGALVAHSAAAMPSVASVARKRLKEDIDRAARGGHLGGVTPALAFNFVSGSCCTPCCRRRRNGARPSKRPPSLPAFSVRSGSRRRRPRRSRSVRSGSSKASAARPKPGSRRE